MKLQIAFDNGGGVTLWTRSYAHHYQDGKQLAADIIAALAGSGPSQWDGNDEDLCLAMRTVNVAVYDDVYTFAQIKEILRGGDIETSEEMVVVDGDRISGHTQSDFWRNVSSR